MVSTISPNQNSKKTIIPLLIFLFVFVLALFFVKPVYDQVGELSALRDAKQSDKITFEKQLNDFKELEANLSKSTEVGKETTLAAIPDRLEQDKLIVDLTTLAKKNDIVLNGVNFGITENGMDVIKKTTIGANLTGNMSGLLSFLRGAETNARKLVIRSITVQTGTESGIDRVNFNVNMDTYYQNRI